MDIEITTTETVELKELVDKYNALIERASLILSQIENGINQN